MRANLLAAQTEVAWGGVYNIGTTEIISIRGLADLVLELCHSTLQPTSAPRRVGNVAAFRPDISKAERYLGYRPTVPLMTGLRRTHRLVHTDRPCSRACRLQSFAASTESQEAKMIDTGKHLTVSLIVPVFNEEEMLAAAMREIIAGLAALAIPFEVVLSENGSMDRTPQLVDGLARDDDRIRVVHLPAADYGQALRQGFLAARGDLLVHFSVDWMDFGFLQTALSRGV